MKVITIIVPVYNEEDTIGVFFDTIEPIIDKIKMKYPVDIDFKLLIINDGSHDTTELIINAAQRVNDNIQLINLSRNFGKEAALSAGLQYAEGNAVIPMDSDLQDPPELIEKLIEKWRQGALIVNAKRRSRRHDSPVKRLCAQLFYKIFNTIGDYRIAENVGDFRLIDRKAVKAINKIHDLSRCNKEVFSWVGFKPAEIEFDRPPRNHNNGKWSVNKLINLSLDGLLSASTLPLRAWTYSGLLIATFGFIYMVFIIGYALLAGRDVPGYSSILVTVLFFSSFNLLSLGILGEYIGRIYKEVRHRPPYIIASSSGIEVKE